jgi:hypothetical protein
VSERLLRTRGPGTGSARFFLVPEGVELPAGELVVRRLDGTTEAVAPDAIAPYEVDAVRAAAHVDAGVERVLGPVRSTLRDLFGGSDEGDAPSGFAKWLGVTPGEVMLDRDKRRQGRRTLIEKAGRLLRPQMSDEDVERIEERLDKIGEAIARDGERLRQETDKLAETLEEQRPAVEAAVQDAAQRLAQLGRAAIGAPPQRHPEPDPEPTPPPAPEPTDEVPPEDAEEV